MNSSRISEFEEPIIVNSNVEDPYIFKFNNDCYPYIIYNMNDTIWWCRIINNIYMELSCTHRLKFQFITILLISKDSSSMNATPKIFLFGGNLAVNFVGL